MTGLLKKMMRMSGRELGYRLRQELWKKEDEWRSHLGLGFIAEGQRGGLEWKGFFEASEGEKRGAWWKQAQPGVWKELERQAEGWCEGHGQLLGYERQDWADGRGRMRWHRDAVSGKESPRVVWSKIPYLNYDAVGDHKVVWELNRHQHWVVLARAWRMSGKQAYLARIEAEWTDWQKQNPYPIGINYASALEVAYRAMSWLWVWQLTGWMGKGMRDALALAGRHLERNLSVYFAPNTHLLGEAIALYWLGEVLVERPEAARWRELGWATMLEQIDRQVLADGLYFERSTHYHVYALELFLLARQIREASGRTIEPRLEEVIDRMAAVLGLISQGGTAVRLGDDDGGRLFDGLKNRGKDLPEALALVDLLRGTHKWRGLVKGVPELALWWFGIERVETYACNPSPWEPQGALLQISGWGVLTKGKESPWQLTFDGGPMGVYGHCHADGLSVQLTHGGVEWVTDPGTGSYMNQGQRSYFRSTAAHSTLRVGGREQAEERGPFGWANWPGGKVEEWNIGQSEAGEKLVAAMDLADGWKHRRAVWVEEEGFGLEDEVWNTDIEARGPEAAKEVEVRFHLGPEVRVCKGIGGVWLEVKAERVWVQGGEGWEMTVEKGKYSVVYGQEEEIQLICYRNIVKNREKLRLRLLPESCMQIRNRD